MYRKIYLQKIDSRRNTGLPFFMINRAKFNFLT